MLTKVTINLHIVEKLVWNLIFLYIFYLFAELSSDILNTSDNIFNFVNWFGPTFFLFICCWTCYRLMKNNFIIFLTPFFSYIFFSALNFGFGALIYTFGNPRSIQYLNAPYHVSTYDLYRTNLLNVIGTLAICIPFILAIKHVKFIRLNRKLQQLSNSDSDIIFVALLFLVIGFAIKYFILLPNIYSSSSVIISNSFTQLGELTLVSLMLFSYLYFSGKGRIYLIILILATLPELLSGLLSFSKLSFLLAPICIFLGYIFVRPKTKNILIGSIIIIAAYLWMVPFVNWARTQSGDSSFNSKLAIASEYFENYEEIANDNNNNQAWWIRLCQVTFQAYVMNEYDRGQPSDNIKKYLLWAFVPRFI